MGYQIYNDFTGKYEDIEEYFTNKRKEFIDDINNLKDKEKLKSVFNIIYEEVINELTKYQQLIKEIEEDKSNLENPLHDKIMYYEPILENYHNLLEFIKREAKKRKVVLDKIIENKSKEVDSDNNPGYYQDEYYIWAYEENQRLVDAVYILRMKGELDRSLKDIELSKLIRSYFRFNPTENIKISTLTTMLTRADKNFNITEIVNENLLDTVRDVIKESKEYNYNDENINYDENINFDENSNFDENINFDENSNFDIL